MFHRCLRQSIPHQHKLRRLLTPHVPVRPRSFWAPPPTWRTSTATFTCVPHPLSFSFSTNTNEDDHYATLGLSNRSATPELIKRAYFEKAKVTHPDLHPTDPTSKAQFQKVNQAYQILKDPEKKAHYDLYGTEQPGTGAGQDEWHAEAWKDAWHTYGFDHYLNALKEDALDAVDDIRYRNDWHLAQRFASKNKLLLLGVFVPFALALRYPPLILGGLRWAFTIAGTTYMHLPRRQQQMIMNQIWTLVKHSTTTRGGKSDAGNGWLV